MVFLQPTRLFGVHAFVHDPDIDWSGCIFATTRPEGLVAVFSL
jgi:hypothetical protein